MITKDQASFSGDGNYIPFLYIVAFPNVSFMEVTIKRV